MNKDMINEIEKSSKVVSLASTLNQQTNPFTGRFTVLDTGVWYRDDNDEQQMICSPLRIRAVTRDEHGNNYGRLLEWHTTDGDIRQWAMPMGMLAGDGQDLRKELLDGGLRHIHSSHKSKRLLLDYIQSANTEDKATCVNKTGWHDSRFVFPDKVIGEQSAEQLILQTEHSGTNLYRQSGTLEQWQQNVARYCQGNSRLTFAVSAAFAAPLLNIIGTDGGGFNFLGSSSEGKSTALYVATSVCGGKEYAHSWRATSNALEGIAANHNDALLPLDEMGQVDPKEVGETAYMLANGQGKARANKSGGSRPQRTWRTLFLSTGEVSLSSHMRTTGKPVKAGQEVRMCDIQMDTGIHGGFENLHNLKSGAEFAEHLNQAANQYYGTAMRAYIAAIVDKRPQIAATVKDLVREFLRESVPAESDGQVVRVANRFALVAAGGELATCAGVTDWSAGEAIQAAEKCFKVWLANRGGNGKQEDQQALEQIATFIQRYGNSRFQSWKSESDERITDRAGYVHRQSHETRYYIFSSFSEMKSAKGTITST